MGEAARDGTAIASAVAALEHNFPMARVKLDRVIPASPPTVVPISSLPPDAQQLVRRRGFTGLYPHQLEAFERAARGESFVLSAPTANGKSLAYMLPAAAALLADPGATALYLSPAKALAQQQLARFKEFAREIECAMYDGDTPKDARAGVRSTARAVFSNPDMLHTSLVAYHRSWSRFWSNLRFVVLDESHLYSGTFGSHVALVMRRMRRVAAEYGSKPTFILLSATIANPAAHAQALLGKRVSLVKAPSGWRGDRRVVLWEPGGPRGSSVDVFTSLLDSGLKVLMFGQSRQGVERMHRGAVDALGQLGRRDLASRVVAYRAGYPAEERRRIEQDLFSGTLRGVIATNALEIGIDIGELDAVVLSFPGSVSSFWQQAGRAGRGEAASLVVTVLRDDPVDAYYGQVPDRLLGASVEHAVVNPTNPVALTGHLAAAAFEVPLRRSVVKNWGKQAESVAQELVTAGKLVTAGDAYLSPERSSPAYNVSIRGIGTRWNLMVDHRVVEEIDEPHALLECFPGAVYVSQGTPYTVASLEPHFAVVNLKRMMSARTVYTQAQRETQVFKNGEPEADAGLNWLGPVSVTQQVMQFRYVDRDGNPQSDWSKVDQPPFRLDTEGLLVEVPKAVRGKPITPAAVHAAEHLLVNALPVVVTADRRDVGSASHTFDSAHRMAFFDLTPGGLGIVRGALTGFKDWVEAALQLARCDCERGCPKCLYVRSCSNTDLNKADAVRVLRVCQLS